MRWLSRLSVVLVVCLIAMALLAAPAQAVCVPWSIELSPKYGVPGTKVTVYGHDFASDKLVDIYYDGDLVTSGRTDSSGDFTLSFTVPEDCQGYYRVLADVGYVEVDTYFHVRPGLTVSPENGPAGTNVTVKGAGFARNEQEIELLYYTNDNYETVERHIAANAQGSWEISFPIPFSTRGEHKIDAQGAVSQSYDVIDATFRVTAEISLDKSSGFAGDTITMAGSRFAVSEKGIKILFDSQELVTGIKADSKGEWEASFQVPEMPAGNYSVTAEGGQTKKEDAGQLSFHIEPDIVLSLAEGHVGMNLTITGHGFAANEDVVIMYEDEDNEVATTRTNAQGSFEVSFPVPESQSDTHQVIARDAAGNNTTSILSMESEPPSVPVLISPANRGRLGLMGEVTPTFEWSAVSDDSGVHYSLQIATSDDFAASSIIASVTGLTETSYTLDKALPNGTYYWIVQAVDGADNESGWTAVSSFRVGLLPMWGLILAIVIAAVLLLILLIRAVVRRRSIYYDRW